MNTKTEILFTAAQLAQAAGISKRTLVSQLNAQGIASRGIVIVERNEAPAWDLADLPEKHQVKITRRAAAAGSADAGSFIAKPLEAFQLRDPHTREIVPLDSIATTAIGKAAKLRRALARVLEMRNSPHVTTAQLEAAGLEDYRREFGYSVTDRTIRALLKRTITRDNFAENWNRLEIYLDGNPQRRAAAGSPQRESVSFAALNDLMANFRKEFDPSPREREALWLEALKWLRGQGSDGADEKRHRIALVKFLWRSAPWLAKSKNALRVALQAKLQRWQENDYVESALKDGRHALKGIPTAPPIDQVLIDNVVACTTFRAGGRTAQGVREVAEMAAELGISHELAELLFPNSRNKSHVNRRLREAVRHEVRMLAPYVIGARALDTERASIERSYNFPSGYCYSADDCTAPVYFKMPDGNAWWNLTRGQFIPIIDVRSLRILGFSLQPDRNYSSPVIHTALKRVFTDFGVPKKLYFERGIWKNSKLITGGPRSQSNDKDYTFMPFSWAETERGFGDLGVEFMHAIRARSKVVERVIGLLQDLMEAEPGYCGRDERRDLPAHTKQNMDALKRHHPGSETKFYDFDQWLARLTEICVKYNATPQQGKILAGMSPNEAWETLQSEDETKRPLFFDKTCAHLLAHYRVIKQAAKDGITITVGKKKWTYRSDELGRDKFKTMLAWFDPDEPSTLAITDMNMKNPYTVPLSHAVDGIDPDPQVLATELERVADYESHGKARYQMLKANFAQKFRRFVPNRSMVETGQAMRQQREIIESGRNEADTRRRRIQNRTATLKIPSRIVTDNPQADEGTAMMLAAKRAAKANQTQVEKEL